MTEYKFWASLWAEFAISWAQSWAVFCHTVTGGGWPPCISSSSVGRVGHQFSVFSPSPPSST